ncbi:CLUMA_CG015035, isoform A [Clunio marinus]|uniref:CLUMA_CG015035, isoform A n=1 Tax=Clunio marinus TaxID=568069 RepID=A0A1J1IQJ8_9DIPT|nr:CLUMA_CG015035, isoform A [Clunio marinus]
MNDYKQIINLKRKLFLKYLLDCNKTVLNAWSRKYAFIRNFLSEKALNGVLQPMSKDCVLRT